MWTAEWGAGWSRSWEARWLQVDWAAPAGLATRTRGTWRGAGLGAVLGGRAGGLLQCSKTPPEVAETWSRLPLCPQHIHRRSVNLSGLATRKVPMGLRQSPLAQALPQLGPLCGQSVSSAGGGGPAAHTAPTVLPTVVAGAPGVSLCSSLQLLRAGRAVGPGSGVEVVPGGAGPGTGEPRASPPPGLCVQGGVDSLG